MQIIIFKRLEYQSAGSFLCLKTEMDYIISII